MFISISYLDPISDRSLGQDQIFGTLDASGSSQAQQGISVQLTYGTMHFVAPKFASRYEASRETYHLQLLANLVENPDYIWLQDIYAH